MSSMTAVSTHFHLLTRQGMHRQTVFNHATHVNICMPVKMGIVIGVTSREEAEGEQGRIQMIFDFTLQKIKIL